MSGNTSRLFHVTDRDSGTRYHIDTGAEVSVIPPTKADCQLQSTSFIRAANGSTIVVYAQRSRTLNLELRRQFRWIFLVADVQVSIIGMDFLHHLDLLVDARCHRPIDHTTQLSVSGISADIAPISSVCIPAKLASVPAHLRTVFQTIIRATSAQPAATDVAEYHIVTGDPPTFARARRLTLDKLKIARAEVEHMLELGIIRPSDSPPASPLHTVPKKSGD